MLKWSFFATELLRRGGALDKNPKEMFIVQAELLPVLKTPRLGVFIEPEVGHGKTEVHEGVQG
jgi:hypothetical protein